MADAKSRTAVKGERNLASCFFSAQVGYAVNMVVSEIPN